MNRKPSIAALALAVLLAALAARGESWRGRFVQLPAELSGVEPAKFPTAVSAGVPGKLPLNASTYVAICALGDMAMERKYIPSAGGAASAPAGPLLTCMAEDGWASPNAARHAQLYDLVYGEIARVPETIKLDGGAEVYPLCMAGLGSTYGFRDLYNALEPNSDGRCPFLYSSMPHPLFASGDWAGGNYTTEDAAAAALKDMLDAFDLRETKTWPSSFDNYGFGMAMYDAVGMSQGPNEHLHYYSITSDAGSYGSGLGTGSPLWAIDPLEANYALSVSYASPVAIPVAAAWNAEVFSNRTWVVSNRLHVAASEVQTVAERLVRADGGAAKLSSTTDSVSVEPTYAAGVPYFARAVKYVQDTRSPTVRVVWECKDTDGGVTWDHVSTKEMTSPKGTLTVMRRKATTTTTATLYDVKVSGIGSRIEDVKVNTMTAACNISGLAKDVGWPHPSSEAWIGGDADKGNYGHILAILLGRRHRRDVAADGTVTSNSVGVICRFPHTGPKTLRDALSNAYPRYLDMAEFDEEDTDADLGTVTLHVSQPSGAGGMSVSTTYSVTFTPDPDAEDDPDHPKKTVYYEDDEDDEGLSHDSDWSDVGVGAVFNPEEDGPSGYTPSYDPPAADETYYVNETVSAWLTRDEPTRDGYDYTETKSAWLEKPDVFAFVFWNFTSL